MIEEKLAMPELKDSPEALPKMERKLLDIIVKYSLYKDIQLQALFDAFLDANSNLPITELTQAIQNTKKILDE
jgi:predicted RNA-binding protein with PIN domain